MKILIFIANILQDVNRILYTRWFDQYFLKTTVKCAVFFNILTIFI